MLKTSRGSVTDMNQRRKTRPNVYLHSGGVSSKVPKKDKLGVEYAMDHYVVIIESDLDESKCQKQTHFYNC